MLLAAVSCAAAARAEMPATTPLPTKTLAQCIAIAIEHHPTLKAATASVDAANQQIWIAAAPYLPNVGASYLVRRQQTFGANANNPSTQAAPSIIDQDAAKPTPGSRTVTNTFNSTGLTFSQLLFDFGQTLAAVRSAQANERSVQDNRTNTLDTVILGVQQSYFNVLATRRLLVVADDTVRQNGKQLEQAEGRHDVGVAPKFDVTTAEVNLANAQLNQVSARNNVAVARETLRNALGINGPLDFDVADTLENPRAPMAEEEALSTAYANRPDLLSAHEQVVAQDEQITSLERQYLPTVNSFGQYLWQGTGALEDTWNVGASVNLSILSGGLTRAQVAQGKATLYVLKYNEESLRQNIALQVRQAVLNVQQAVESIAVAAKGQQEARENMQIADGRYTTGVGNIIEVTTAQVQQTTAEANYVQALYSYQTSVAQLENAIGKPVVLENP